MKHIKLIIEADFPEDENGKLGAPLVRSFFAGDERMPNANCWVGTTIGYFGLMAQHLGKDGARAIFEGVVTNGDALILAQEKLRKIEFPDENI